MPDNISAIGSYGGLGTAGLYGSYYDPSMMSMMNGYGTYGMTNPMLGSMGMMGMYNPTFMAQQTEMMKQMYSAQNEIQKMQLQNQTEMHREQEFAKAQNVQDHDEAFFKTVMVDGDFKDYIREIYTGIRNGQMDYVANRYFELKQAILNKYGDHFNSSAGRINDNANLDQYISVLYSEYGAGLSGDGIKPDLRSDILKYGENAFQHGFNTAFMGNKDHTKSTAEEALYQIYGTPIEDKGSKAKSHWLGEKFANVAEVGVSGAAGAALGAAALTVGKIFTPSWLGSVLSKGVNKGYLSQKFVNRLASCGKFGTWIKGGAAALALGDIVWQLSR